MWSCRYHARRPVEIMILARNPSPKSTDKFSLSQMKIWNFNKSINVRTFLLNPYLTNGLSHPYHFDKSTLIFRSIRSNFTFSFFDEIPVSKQ